MPYAFVFAEIYENTVTGLPFAMVKDSLSHGLYVTGNTLGEYSYDSENQSFFRNVTGSYPLIFLCNRGTLTGFADQGPYEISRNVAGFGSMELQFLGPDDRVVAGTRVPVTVKKNSLQQSISIFPNPADTYFRVEGANEGDVIALTDLLGRQVHTGILEGSRLVDVAALPQGLYIISISDPDSGHPYPAIRLIKY
jgi:hypothetical protein